MSRLLSDDFVAGFIWNFEDLLGGDGLPRGLRQVDFGGTGFASLTSNVRDLPAEDGWAEH
jgi:hypothetical protein